MFGLSLLRTLIDTYTFKASENDVHTFTFKSILLGTQMIIAKVAGAPVISGALEINVLQ